MMFPLSLSPGVDLVVAVLLGIAFGFVLERAGLGHAPKLVAQFYGDDLTVLKVMFGAIVTALVGLAVASSLGLLDFAALAEAAATETVLVPMAVGGVLLGVGFVVSGYCPGTSFVAAASGKIDALLVVIGVIAGELIWAELQDLPGVSGFHEAGARGTVFLWDLLQLPARIGPYVLAVAVTSLALGCFAGAEKLEQALSKRVGWRTR